MNHAHCCLQCALHTFDIFKVVALSNHTECQPLYCRSELLKRQIKSPKLTHPNQQSFEIRLSRACKKKNLEKKAKKYL